MKDITKREYFAAMALQGLLAHHGVYDEGYERSFRTFKDELGDFQQPDVEGYIPNEYTADGLAATALTYADELIKKISDEDEIAVMSKVTPHLLHNGDICLLSESGNSVESLSLKKLVSSAVKRYGKNRSLLNELIASFEECTSTLKEAVSKKT